MIKLHRYWFEFAYPESEPDEGIVLDGHPGPDWCGVTAWNRDDADALLAAYFRSWGMDVPVIGSVIEDVDIRSLSDDVQRLISPPVWRGVWYPPGSSA